MLQRIQTVYLFLVLLFAVLFLVFPVASLDLGHESVSIKLYEVFGVHNYLGLEGGSFTGIISLVLPFIIMVLSLYTTFQYKNRFKQIKLGKINIFLHVGLVVSTFFYLDQIKSIFQGAFSYGAGIVFPLVAMVLVLLANRAIKKDEDLVRSADRLR